MTQDTLQPCPHCGKRAAVMHRSDVYQAYCSDPNCLSIRCYDTAEEAAAAWNTRAECAPSVDVEAPTFDKAIQGFGDWESEAYSRGICIEDDDIEKLRLFYEFLESRGLLKSALTDLTDTPDNVKKDGEI